MLFQCWAIALSSITLAAVDAEPVNRADVLAAMPFRDSGRITVTEVSGWSGPRHTSSYTSSQTHPAGRPCNGPLDHQYLPAVARRRTTSPHGTLKSRCRSECWRMISRGTMKGEPTGMRLSRAFKAYCDVCSPDPDTLRRVRQLGATDFQTGRSPCRHRRSLHNGF